MYHMTGCTFVPHARHAHVIGARFPFLKVKWHERAKERDGGGGGGGGVEGERVRERGGDRQAETETDRQTEK